ncbi:4-hydroxy-tetrahydrodipicolinate reductase [Rhodoligotrophos ferricapiens]|uniref:4-hydroxy-tetrahydrodipicolinate reductase n=1 Tax=Rhodoligotrophos ferricapiens TaxID=3069264 RepID=UPI00315D5206
MTAMRIAIAGAGGRMGRTLTRLVHEMDGCEVAGGLEAPGSSLIGADMGQLAGIGEIGVTIQDDPLPLFTRIDGIIDFTTPAASLPLADLAAQARIVDVIGTTGFSPEDDKRIAAAARHATIVKSGNMSLGVNLLAAMIRKVAAALDESFDIEVVEMHHRNKVDAPSGTALLLGQAAAEGRKVGLSEASVRVRDGHTGPRQRGTIGFATLRGGSVIGDHTVIFAGDGERVELGHRAEGRDVFGRGAVKAALWARGRKPGLYSMADVLGLTD